MQDPIDDTSAFRICLRDVGGPSWVAGSIYAQNIAYAIATLPNEEREGVSVVIQTPDVHSEGLDALAGLVDDIYTPTRWEHYTRLLAQRLRVPLPSRVANPHRFDFVYPEHRAAWMRTGWAAWIPDFQHLYLPELFSTAECDRRDHLFGQMAQLAPVVVVSSQMAANDFATRYPNARASAEVLHFASRMDDSVFTADTHDVTSRYNIDEDFLIVSNQFWAHKGYDTLVEGLVSLRRRGARVPRVVCTGSPEDHRNPGYMDELRARMNAGEVADQVMIVGHIPRADQLQLMRASTAVIQPSRFEGWSTVVEDARALGKPMILSDFPVHLEQAPVGARYFTVGDAEALADAIASSDDLSPGPDLARESAARADNSERLAATGRRLLEIARKASF